MSETSVHLSDCLQRLSKETAATEWRGLCLVRCAATVTFKWPAEALVLDTQMSAYRQYLGTSQSMLVLDMRETLHADALAASLPTLRAKGLAVLLLPVKTTPFSKRLIDGLPASYCELIDLTHPTAAPEQTIDMSGLQVTNAVQIPTLQLPRLTLPTPQLPILPRRGITLCQEQSVALDKLIQHVECAKSAPALVNAARGRGKSTLLGFLARKLAAQGRKVFLCAPSRRQAETLLKVADYENQLAQSDALISFIAPDKLLVEHSAQVQGVVIVDEAANLPRHMLDKLIKRYPGVIMATTSEGYETCGRGFLLQFQRQLTIDYPSFLSLTLYQPIRFAAECPVEAWLHRALLLNPGLSPYPSLLREPKRANDSAQQLEYAKVRACELDEPTLSACFDLLMDAHYQTSPNDLKLLLDNTTQTLVLQWQVDSEQRTLTGVAWLSQEGGLDPTLAETVMLGTRRPAGNLLAQSLARHLQTPEPASAVWLRVVRIAVRSDLQQRGLGSALLDYLVAHSSRLSTSSASIAGIGTSFASAPQINRFWSRHGFLPIRLGSRKDSVTARHALLMLHPLDNKWAAMIRLWAAYFAIEADAYRKLFQLSDAYLASVSNAALQIQPAGVQSLYAQWATHKVHAFAHGWLDLDSIRATLLSRYPQQVADNPLLNLAVFQGSLTQADKQYFQLTGRQELIKKLRQVCLQLSGQL